MPTAKHPTSELVWLDLLYHIRYSEAVMPYSVTFNEEAGFIHAIYEGDLDMLGITSMMRDVGQQIRDHDCYRVLSDYSQARMAISIADLYEMPKLILKRSKEMGVSAYKIKRALIIPLAAYEKFRFFETVSLNNSQTVKIFTDVDQAKEWLLEK